MENERRYSVKALAFLVAALFLLACSPTPPTPKIVPVTTRLVETIEPEPATGNPVILCGSIFILLGLFCLASALFDLGWTIIASHEVERALEDKLGRTGMRVLNFIMGLFFLYMGVYPILLTLGIIE